MSLTQDQEIALALSGTVRIPSPAPAAGALEVLVLTDPGIGLDGLMIRVVHAVSRRLTIARTVRLTDVRAAKVTPRVESPPPPPGGASSNAPAAPVEPRFLTGRQFVGHVEAFLRDVPEPVGKSLRLSDEAAIYVPESAPVLLSVEAGLTAAESVDYYPPLGRNAPGGAAGASAPGGLPLHLFKLLGGTGVDVPLCRPTPIDIRDRE